MDPNLESIPTTEATHIEKDIKLRRTDRMLSLKTESREMVLRGAFQSSKQSSVSRVRVVDATQHG